MCSTCYFTVTHTLAEIFVTIKSICRKYSRAVALIYWPTSEFAREDCVQFKNLIAMTDLFKKKQANLAFPTTPP